MRNNEENKSNGRTWVRRMFKGYSDEEYAEAVAVMEHYFNKYADPDVATDKYFNYRFDVEPIENPPSNLEVRQIHMDVAQGKRTEQELGIFPTND